jgi:predicted phage terminase large subunit-like protein
MPDLRIQLWTRHAGQKQLAREARRFNIACMGRRWGKTRFGIDLLMDKGMALEGRPVGWFAPQYKLLEEVYREARRVLQPVIVAANSQQHRLELLGGGTIDFWTLDNPDAGRGRKYARVIIDEAAMARNLEEAWTQAIRPTLADLSGDAWFLSTPKGKGFFKTLFDKADSDPDWMRWQMPTSTNPYIQPGEIEAMRHDLSSIVFQQEILAEFVDMAGAVIQREWLRVHPAPTHLPVVLGVDLALSTKETADYTAVVALCRNPDSGQITVLDAQRARVPFHAALQFIQQMAAKWNPVSIAVESVQYQAAAVQELLRTTTLPVQGVRPEGDKLLRFQPLIARYEQGLIYHAPGLPGCFEDELLSFPVGDHDDLVDALAYAWRALPNDQLYQLAGGVSRRFEDHL